MESNDSPEIPDRGKTLDISGLPSRSRNTGGEISVWFLPEVGSFSIVWRHQLMHKRQNLFSETGKGGSGLLNCVK